jgi:hypothetical protein
MTQGYDWFKKILESEGARGRGPRGVPPGGGAPGAPTMEVPSRRNLLTIGAVLVGLWGLWSCFYTVQPEERAVNKRLGKVIGGWQRNALRHSFISYRAAQVGLGKAALEAGNSETEARRSYNDSKTEAEAGEWFAPF